MVDTCSRSHAPELGAARSTASGHDDRERAERDHDDAEVQR
jgi:hypothetical protein